MDYLSKHSVVSAGNSSASGSRIQGCRQAGGKGAVRPQLGRVPRIRTSAYQAVPQPSVATRGGRTLARDMICLFRCPPAHRLSRRSPRVQPVRGFATGAESPRGRCCTASFARTWLRSWPKPQNATPAANSPTSLPASSSATCAAACFATASPGSAVPPAARSCSSPSPAITAACVRRAPLGAWRTPRPTFGTWSCPRSRFGSG